MKRGRLLGFLLAAAIAFGVSVPAQAAIQIDGFSTTTSETQAGGHPDLTTSFTLHDPGLPEAAKEVVFNAPEGVFGNPNALTRCTASDFALDECPVNAQAGIVTIRGNYEGDPGALLGTAPIFDISPQENETARFSLIVPTLGIPIAIPVAVRTGSDYGLRFTVAEITQQIPLNRVDFTLWGMPGLKAHNVQRFEKGSPGNPAGCPGLADTSCISSPTPVSIAVQPLIDYPTICTGEPLLTTLDVRSYQTPEASSHAGASYPPTTGCERENFNPVLSASLTTGETDSASGLNLGFRVPQTFGFTPSPSEARSVTVTFPPGLTVNPDAADGQSACSDAEANFGSEAAAHCADRAKIGTTTIGTPALDGPLVGSIYIGEPKPGDQYRLFMVLSGFGLNAKLIGSVKPDPDTGQLTAEFTDLPQVPFEEFDIHLFASDRGLLATPTNCTLYPVKALFTPWNEQLPSQGSEAFFGLTSGPNGADCPGEVRPFEPRLVAGTSSAAAGAFSSFHLKLDRDDGDQFLSGVNFTMPPGLTGNLTGISYCPEAAIAAAAGNAGRLEQAGPSCPSSSQIGTTNVSAGPGSHPFHAVGRMYLAGPFKGAPLSLAAVTPALAGPYDYGVVVVRVAIRIDPLDAHVVADSEAMPQIIGGIPIRMRSIQVNIDRDNFMINPTRCTPMSVDSQGVGDQETVTDFSSYFHAFNCRSLAFKPRMKIRLKGGKRETRRLKNPRLQFDLFTRPGDANIRSVTVTLPRSFQIDQRHLSNICSKSQLEMDRCAGRQPMGKVWVRTPLLDDPLQGVAYAVSGFAKLPRLVFILDGQVLVMPQARSSSVRKGHLKTVVPVVPDVPIGHFRLSLLGGSKGYLINSKDLCRHGGAIAVSFAAQSGKAQRQRIKPRTRCGAKGRTKHHRR